MQARHFAGPIRSVIALLLSSGLLRADIAFTPLGDLPGGSVNSIAKAISADGSTVVGYSSSADGNGGEAFRWTSATGIVGLGDLPGGNFFSQANAVSTDGSVIVGTGSAASGFSNGWRWTSAEGLVATPDLPGGIDNGGAVGISGDGLTLAGTGYNADNHSEAYLWTALGGHTPAGFFSGGNTSEALGLSPDGLVLVGKATRSTGYTAAFRWTSTGGMQDLGYLPGGDSSTANAANADGSVVVGVSFVANFGRRAFRWTEAGGLVDLGLLGASGTRSEALACSADGSVVVGYSEGGASGDSAFVWDASNGMRGLKSLVQAAGLAKRWTQFSSATGISADGTKITGYGINSLGQTEAFLIDLNAPTPPPPPPATAGIVWTEDLPQTEPLKANSVVRLAYDNGTGVTDIATLTGGANGGWGGVEYSGGYLLVPSSANTGTGTRNFAPRYAPILVTNLYAYDYDFTPGYLWAVNGSGRQVIKYATTGPLNPGDGGAYDRNWISSRTQSTGRFTNAVQVVGDTVYFSSSVTDPIGLYKTDAGLLSPPVAVFTQSGAGAAGIYDFEVVGDLIYFGDITNHAIKRVNTDGTGLVTLVANANFPNGIDVTNDAIYWTEHDTRLIRRAGLDGSNPVTIRELDNTPRGIAVVPLAFIDGPAPQAVAISGLATNFTGAANTPVTLAPSATSGLPVTLEILSGPATVSGNTITYTGAGEVRLRATQDGDAAYSPASFDYTITANPRLAQSINFPAPAPVAYTGSPLTFTPFATASSGLTVNFFIVSGPASWSATTRLVTVNGAGTVVIRATQSGNATYAPAPFIDRSFTVTDGPTADPFLDYLTSAGVPAETRGALDDPDGDGLGNLLEFALGRSPVVADSAGATTIETTGDALTLHYRRAQGALVTYQVETTTDLAAPGSWTPTGVDQGGPDTEGNTIASVPLAGAPRFLRLRVTYGTP